MEIKKVLNGVIEIDGVEIIVMDRLREGYPERFTESGQMDWGWFENEIRPNHFVYTREDKNSIAFTLADEENEVRGVSLTEAILVLTEMLDSNIKNLGIQDQESIDNITKLKQAANYFEAIV